MEMYNGVSQVDEVAYVIQHEPEWCHIVQLPEYGSADDEHYVVENGQRDDR